MIEEKISPHQRFGLRLLQVLIIIMAILLVRDCILISTEKQLTQQQESYYFQLGYKHGKLIATGTKQSLDLKQEFSHPAIRKKYHEGFRAGWDATRKDDSR